MNRKAWKTLHRGLRNKSIDTVVKVRHNISGNAKVGYTRFATWDFATAILCALINQSDRMINMNRREALEIIKANRRPSKLAGF